MRRSVLVLATGLAACAGAVDLGQTAWRATFNGGPAGISGSLGAVSTSGRTHVSIAIQRGLPGQQYGWRIQHGDCQSEGALVGSASVYPTLTAADDGTAGTDNVFLSQTLSAGPYVARVVKVLSSGEILAACAGLEAVP